MGEKLWGNYSCNGGHPGIAFCCGAAATVPSSVGSSNTAQYTHSISNFAYNSILHRDP